MISIVVPVYRSAEILNELYSRIDKVMTSSSLQYELIFIEDCGGDNSWEVINEICREHNHVRGYQMFRNFGQHNALLCGIRKSEGEIIITMDDDLQHPPEEIPALLERLKEGYDVVYGIPKEEQHGIARNMASVITKFALQTVMGAENARIVSAFRAFRTDLRKAFEDYRSSTISIDALLSWATNSFTSVRVAHCPRSKGSSGYNTKKLIIHALNMMTGYSSQPLQFASISGFLFALFGLGILFYVVIGWFVRGSVVPGFAFIASIISIFSGVQLVSIGIIGEYLARTHFMTMGRPQYMIRNDTQNF